VRNEGGAGRSIRAEARTAFAQGTSRQGGDSERFIAAYAPIIKNIAQRIVTRLPPCITLGGSHQCWRAGLIDASKKYDPTRASTFRLYARQQRITTPCTTTRCSDAVESMTQ